jgi:hypothetical protein
MSPLVWNKIRQLRLLLDIEPAIENVIAKLSNCNFDMRPQINLKIGVT